MAITLFVPSAFPGDVVPGRVALCLDLCASTATLLKLVFPAGEREGFLFGTGCTSFNASGLEDVESCCRVALEEEKFRLREHCVDALT
jgi:hypothetical protein